MQPSHFLLLASTLLTSASACQVSALPLTIQRRDWTSNAKGNLKISFSDDTVNLGTITPDAVMDKLMTACSTNGLCDTSPVTLKGQAVGSGTGDVDSETLTITPSGDFPTWIHNGLGDALRAAIKAAADCKQVTNTPTCGFSASYCPSKPFTVTECTVPQYWGVNYQPADLGNAAPPFMALSLNLEVDKGSFCSTFTTIGGAVAGAVNGAAGGIFTLIGLACH